MKHLKTLGLAAVAAAALMAFIGASSASATVLCQTTPNAEGKCPTGWAYTGELHAITTEKPKLTTTFKTVECDESTVMGFPEGEGGASSSLRIPLSALTFTGHCNCTVIPTTAGNLEINVNGDSGNGTLASNNATVTVSCSTIFGTVHCDYVTNEHDLGTLVGGVSATISITVKIEEENTSALCDSEATWHANYRFTTPSGLWVATST